MTVFTLLVVPDGKALLTTPEVLTQAYRALILDQVRAWRDGEYPVALIDNCDVVQVASVDFDLEPVAD